ncbi:PucR family transcriptional regulator [Amycolatopsis anabasis]|uniref:PucR family transcriptional regulator n=1 Tax=Amycolatopsis anabasis TaxID=1840409 RepID=UPI00131BB970|nr:helix-turn-helix domain-containing protein [Amycolatopsis anabasis]
MPDSMVDAPHSAAEVRHRQRDLLRVLLGERPRGPSPLAELARAAGWPMPGSVASVLLDGDGPGSSPLIALPPDVLADLDRPDPCLLVPDRWRGLDETLRGRTAVVGPAVSPVDAASSLGWARRLAEVLRAGLVRATGIVRCADHLSTLVLVQDRALVRILVEDRLAPLLELRSGAQRDALADTLFAWLRAGGSAPACAARLHVHPQTVRYRLRKLTALFGERLADPDLRLELLVALAAQRLLRGEGRSC